MFKVLLVSEMSRQCSEAMLTLSYNVDFENATHFRPSFQLTLLNFHAKSLLERQTHQHGPDRHTQTKRDR
jgi:hypothetical protein